MADAGYSAPLPRTDIPAPGESVLATLKLAVWTMREGEFISDYDVKVANWAAYALCGGKVTPGDAGERAVSAGSGAGGVSLAVR
jgi:3-hydroxyacyl-CoA dehydrogenase